MELNPSKTKTRQGWRKGKKKKCFWREILLTPTFWRTGRGEPLPLWELLERLAGMSVTVGGRKCGSLDEALAGAQAGDTIAISGALSAQQLIIPAHLAGQPHPRYLSRVAAAACVMLSLALLVQGWWLPGPEARPSRWTRGPSCRAPRLASRSRG